MRVITFVTTTAILLFPLGAGPSTAARRGVRLVVTPVEVPFDSGFQVVALCSAEATSDVVTDVPSATVVACSINGVEAARGMPGGQSYVTVTNTVPGAPYTICISGQVAFVNSATDDLELVSDGPYCEPVAF